MNCGCVLCDVGKAVVDCGSMVGAGGTGVSVPSDWPESFQHDRYLIRNAQHCAQPSPSSLSADSGIDDVIS